MLPLCCLWSPRFRFFFHFPVFGSCGFLLASVFASNPIPRGLVSPFRHLTILAAFVFAPVVLPPFHLNAPLSLESAVLLSCLRTSMSPRFLDIFCPLFVDSPPARAIFHIQNIPGWRSAPRAYSRSTVLLPWIDVFAPSIFCPSGSVSLRGPSFPPISWRFFRGLVPVPRFRLLFSIIARFLNVEARLFLFLWSVSFSSLVVWSVACPSFLSSFAAFAFWRQLLVAGPRRRVAHSSRFFVGPSLKLGSSFLR